jgi:hypothetical protein
MDSPYALFRAPEITQPPVKNLFEIKSQHILCTVTYRSYNTPPLIFSGPLTVWSLLYERCDFSEVQREI